MTAIAFLASLEDPLLPGFPNSLAPLCIGAVWGHEHYELFQGLSSYAPRRKLFLFLFHGFFSWA